MCYLQITQVIIIVASLVGVTLQNGDIRTFRQLYQRQASKRLSAIPRDQIHDTNVEACAELCVKEQDYLCKSFDINNEYNSCLLFEVDHEDSDVILLPETHTDHYQSAYLRLFDKTSKHRLHTWMNSQREECSVEQCARMCVLETRYKCQSFNYDARMKVCRMTQYSEGQGYGLTADETIDFYERKSDDGLKQFINFGQVALTPLRDTHVYDRLLEGLTLEQCAAHCLNETDFRCNSFDYKHEADKSMCYMSKYIAANVRGLRKVTQRINHYQRIEKDLSYFYASPNTILLGNDIKKYNLVTPDHCALMCIQEEGFVCRSFDYEVIEGKCSLSDKTGSDVGGLYHGALAEVHHFEMKPILDCGGNMTGPSGDFASPGWPRNYSHHEECSWNISVPINKIISITFTHLDIAVTSPSSVCDENNDRLLVVENKAESCIKPFTTSHQTKSNQAIIKFYSNHEKDAQGFRAFYTAEWTCDAYFTTAPGDFASPQWPQNYPTAMLCSWRIRADDNQRVRLYFTSFQLAEHLLGHCNADVDYVKVLDGGSVNSKLIGLFCGEMEPFDIKSTGTDLFVQFFSNTDRTDAGFHATFVFESASDLDLPQPPPDRGGIIHLGPEEDGDDEDDDVSRSDVEEDSEESHDSVEDGKEGSEEKEIEVDDDVIMTGSEGHKQAGNPKPAYAHSEHGYNGSLWVVITILILLLTITTVSLFLVWRHYKRQVEHLTHLLQTEEPLLSEETAVIFKPKKNNVTLGNEVDLYSQGACGGSGSSSSSADSSDLYAKYTKENTKNVNLDVKYVANLEEKSNLSHSASNEYV